MRRGTWWCARNSTASCRSTRARRASPRRWSASPALAREHAQLREQIVVARRAARRAARAPRRRRRCPRRSSTRCARIRAREHGDARGGAHRGAGRERCAERGVGARSRGALGARSRRPSAAAERPERAEAAARRTGPRVHRSAHRSEFPAAPRTLRDRERVPVRSHRRALQRARARRQVRDHGARGRRAEAGDLGRRGGYRESRAAARDLADDRRAGGAAVLAARARRDLRIARRAAPRERARSAAAAAGPLRAGDPDHAHRERARHARPRA